MMSNNKPLVVTAAIALLVGAGLAVRMMLREQPRDATVPASAPSPAAPNVVERPVPVQATLPPASAQQVADELPEELKRKYLPGTKIPITLPKVKSGIRCPDGSFLPLLNGVPNAPAISRDREHGPVPPVRYLYVDDQGFEWFWHEDGSTTTSRYVKQWNNGVESTNIETLHAVPVRPGAAVPMADPKVDGRGSGQAPGR